MKKSRIMEIIIIVWALGLCLFIGKNIYDDVKNNKNNTLEAKKGEVVEESFEINGVVGEVKNDEVNDEEIAKDNKEQDEEKNKVTTTKNESKDKSTDNTASKSNTSSNDNLDNKSDNKTNNETNNNETKEVTEKNIVLEKYGTVIYDEITYVVKDGEKTKKSVKRIVDASNYHATLNDLKNEAATLIKNNQNAYEEVLNYTNNYRNEVSLNNLTLDDNLTLLATIRALEMAYTNNFSHTRLDNTNCTDLAKDLNISFYTMGENIAYGYNNSESVTKGWRNSKGHYENMINSGFNKLGVGSFKFNGNVYWVQIFSN